MSDVTIPSDAIPAKKPGSVHHLNPKDINYDNIPFILRDIANKIDKGKFEGLETLLVIGLFKDDDDVDLFHIGKAGSRLTELGALHRAALMFQEDNYASELLDD